MPESKDIWSRVRKDVFVVAEIGKNFIQIPQEEPVEIYLEKAKKLVDAAILAGVDAVKFQTHEVEDEQLNVHVVSPHFKSADRHSWVTRNTRATPLETFWRPLKNYCSERGIVFFSTPMSRLAAQKLAQIDVPMWKVGSGDAQDYVLLDFLTSTGKPIIISTGMVSLEELDEVVRYLRTKQSQFALLYCVSKYPCQPEEFNLGTIEYLREKYPDAVIGFSDHSLGYQVAGAAVKLGARIIEKHFSLSRDYWGSDHKVSLTPKEMGEFTQTVRVSENGNIDERKFYGVFDRELEGAKNQFHPYFNRSLVAARDLPVGHVLTAEDMYSMRPQMYIDGLPASAFFKAIGRRLAEEVKKYEPISESKLWKG